MKIDPTLSATEFIVFVAHYNVFFSDVHLDYSTLILLGFRPLWVYNQNSVRENISQTVSNMATVTIKLQ